MADFTEPYDSLAAWDFGTSPTTNLTLASTSPAPYQGPSRSTILHNSTVWGAARFDLIDGGVNTTTYWISYAIYVDNWADIFNASGFAYIPGFINYNDDPLKGATTTDGVIWFIPYLQADSTSAGRVWPIDGGGSGTLISAGAWHTVRVALKANGASSYTELWVDNSQVYTATVDYTFYGVDAASGLMGVVHGDFGDTGTTPSVTYYHDTLMYSAAGDPGEPTEGGVSAESDPSPVVTDADSPSGNPPGSGLGPGGTGGDCDIQVFLDGVDVSGVSIEGSVTRRLNRPAQASIKIPMDSAIGCPGSRLQVWFDGTLYFHGMVMDLEVDSAEDDGYSVYNASDPMELWQWRVVRADDGDFSRPAGDGGVDDLFATYITGPEIMNAVMMNTEGSTTAQGNPALNPPSQTEGPTFLNFAGFATNGCDLTGAPVDWPQTIQQLFSLLASTGCLDAVITPTDPGGGIMGDLNFYNGDYGTDLSASVSLQYGMGNYTVRNVRWNQDMSQIVNKLWYYGGPRVGTAADPAGDQHWCWNIQGQDPVFNPDGTAELVPPGGTSVDSNNDPANFTNNPLGQRIYDSRYTDGCYGGTFDDGYGVRMQVNIFDGLSDTCLGEGSFDPERWLYRRLWQAESWARAVPRDLIHVTPIRGYPIGNFDIGDIITVEAVSTVMGGFSGAQRIYQYTISWSEDGPCEISELQTSSDVGIDTGV